MRSTRPLLLGTLGAALFVIAIVTVSAQVRRQAFPDVARDRSYAAAVERYARLGILQGYESGSFGPNDSLKRSEIALVLQRMEDTMIAPLREQVEQIRRQLNLGRCGDDVLQTSEACDDGNTFDDDGCSSECLKETFFSTSFPPSSASSMTSSSSSSQPEPEPEPQSSSSRSAPVLDMPEKTPICGNGVCEYNEISLPPDKRFYCPQDCTDAQPEHVCRPLTTKAITLAEEDLTCATKEDCTIVEQSCPFITCGIPVNKVAYATKTLEMRDAVAACKIEGMASNCVICPYVSPYCQNGQCILKFNQR